MHIRSDLNREGSAKLANKRYHPPELPLLASDRSYRKHFRLPNACLSIYDLLLEPIRDDLPMPNYQERRRSLLSRHRDFASQAHDLAGKKAHLRPLAVQSSLLFGIVRGK